DALKGRTASIVVSARPMSDPDPGYLTQTTFSWTCANTGDCSVYDDGAARFFPKLAQVDRWDYSSTSSDDLTWTTGAHPATPTSQVASAYAEDACGSLTDETATDTRHNSVRKSHSDFASLNGGCDGQLRVCNGICDRPARTYQLGELAEGGTVGPVIDKTFGY